jgi:lipoprotein-anchoring transpeptidase ErfK/SrfK
MVAANMVQSPEQPAKASDAPSVESTGTTPVPSGYVEKPKAVPQSLFQSPSPSTEPVQGPPQPQPVKAIIPTPGALAPLLGTPENAVPAQEPPDTAGSHLLASLTAHAPLSDGEIALQQTDDYSWQAPTSWNVTSYKTAHKVDIYYKGHLFRSYHAVFGRNPDPGTKQWEGDLRTPEGVYAIIDKYYSPRFKRFFLLNYPNQVDRERYQSMLDDGVVPVSRRHLRPIGGAVGIHGTDRPRFNRQGINWTSGCISVDNDAILDLEKILPLGTVVIIKQ